MDGIAQSIAAFGAAAMAFAQAHPIAAVLVAWSAISVPAGMFVGAVIRGRAVADVAETKGSGL